MEFANAVQQVQEKRGIFPGISGLHLCEQHFEADVEAKAKHEIRRHRWMIPGDHIAVALSGGPKQQCTPVFFEKTYSKPPRHKNFCDYTR